MQPGLEGRIEFFKLDGDPLLHRPVEGFGPLGVIGHRELIPPISSPEIFAMLVHFGEKRIRTWIQIHKAPIPIDGKERIRDTFEDLENLLGGLLQLLFEPLRFPLRLFFIQGVLERCREPS